MLLSPLRAVIERERVQPDRVEDEPTAVWRFAFMALIAARIRQQTGTPKGWASDGR